MAVSHVASAVCPGEEAIAGSCARIIDVTFSSAVRQGQVVWRFKLIEFKERNQLPSLKDSSLSLLPPLSASRQSRGKFLWFQRPAPHLPGSSSTSRVAPRLWRCISAGVFVSGWIRRVGARRLFPCRHTQRVSREQQGAAGLVECDCRSLLAFGEVLTGDQEGVEPRGSVESLVVEC